MSLNFTNKMAMTQFGSAEIAFTPRNKSPLSSKARR